MITVLGSQDLEMFDPGEIHGPATDEPGSRKEPVPRVTDHVYSAPKINRNFIHWNALSQMRSAPPEKNDPKLVDAPNGNCQSLEKSGLKPKYAFKKVKKNYLIF